ncbi:coiled-coil domain-containing protein 62-like [Asterias amurensis]|uniref:coiled-coil domain-containing protein 62-like n=1 Tax=Asterias amurensis TaxID=7602 RepID=UPI003AB24CB0
MEGTSFSTPAVSYKPRDFTSASKRYSRLTTGNAQSSYEPYHSTPKQPSPGSAHITSYSTSSLPVGHSSGTAHSYVKGSPSVGMGKTSPSPNRVRAGSPSRGFASPPRHNYVSELETTTIQKQRKELHLLIGELQDRDRELNEMVASHQKQLLAWEQDRQKLLTLEQRYSRLEGELKSRSEQLKSQSTQLKVLESQDQSKELALQSTQKQLEQMSEKASAASRRAHELEEHTVQLNGMIRDLSSKVGQFEAREQELVTMLKLKDNDLAEASAHITDMSGKLKRFDRANKEIRQTEAATRKELATLKQKWNGEKQELDKMKGQLNEQNNTNTEQSIELGQLQGDLQALQQELTLAGEREKRKDQLLELQRSKQERTDAELTNLRQVYERQHRDLSLLQLNLDSKNEVLIRSQLSNSLHDEHTRSHNASRSPGNLSRKSHESSLPNNNSLIEGGLVDDNGEPGGPEFSSGDTEDLLTADSSGETQAETSPTSKLHRLLTESRQMVQNLEQTTLPPYMNKPNKQDEQSRANETGDQN